MDFSLTEEQTAVQELAAKILADLSGSEHHKAIDKQAVRFDKSLWNELAKAGLIGVGIEEVYGGMGMGFETLCLLIEEAGKTLAPIPLVDNLVTAAMSLQKFADESVKTSLLPKVASGEVILSAGLFDERPINPGLPDMNLKGLELTGSKSLVSYAAQSHKILLKADSFQGTVIVLIDTDNPQLKLETQQSTTGEPVCTLHCDKLLISTDAIIAEGSDADYLVNWIRDYSIAAHCAMAVGVTAQMLQMTARYTSEREQFGVPVATFQAVAHRAADSYIDVENLRLVTQQAVSQLARQTPAHTEVLIAKVWCGDVCHRVSQASQHLHGGIGVDRDYPLFRYCLWAKQLEMTMGSSSVYLQKLGDDIAAEFKRAASQ